MAVDNFGVIGVGCVRLATGACLALLGLSFKPNTVDLRDEAGLLYASFGRG